MSATDFEVNDQGSIVLLTPMTESATDWVADNLPSDAMTFGLSIVIEHRYAQDILAGISDDGLTVGGLG